MTIYFGDGTSQAAAGLSGAGKILQVITTYKNSTWSSSSNNSFHEVSGLSAAITPASTSNKVFIFISLGVLGSNNNTAGVRIYRSSDSTWIGQGAGSGSRPTFAFGAHQRGEYSTVTVNRTNGDQNDSNLESGRRSSSITLMEVSG